MPPRPVWEYNGRPLEERRKEKNGVSELIDMLDVRDGWNRLSGRSQRFAGWIEDCRGRYSDFRRLLKRADAKSGVQFNKELLTA